MIGIGADLLLSLYQPRGAVGFSSAGAPARKAAPTAPWESASTAPQAKALVRSVLAGRRFIQPETAQLDAPGASADYRKLFGLYQGLNALNALAERADARGVSSTERAQIERRFAAGLTETDAFLQTLDMDKLRLIRGEATSAATTGTGVKRDKAEYLTGVVQTGSAAAEASSLTGDVRFSLAVTRPGGEVVEVAIDLADMGGQPRSLTNVVAHLNARLDATNILTRFEAQKLPAEVRTKTIAGRTVTLPPSPDQWALKIKGVLTETVSFDAPEGADAVYLVQDAGVDDPKAGTAAGRQLLKFQTDQGGAPPPAARPPGETDWSVDRVFTRPLGPQVAAVRATASGPDGSVYVLGDVDGPVDGQGIKGVRDVALLRYDAAGALIYARTLGAADEAQGYALAVSAEGQVAVAGSVKGALGGVEAPIDKLKTDSFVTLFDAAGEELWTRRRGAGQDDEARAVAFAADGTVFVGGRARSAMPGAGVEQGGWDGYLQSFNGTDGTALASTQFGGAGDDGVWALAVQGAAVVVAGEEGGRAVLRRFDTDAAGGLTAGAVRDLGDLQGAIVGVAFDADGVVVAGSTSNGALAAGSVNGAYSGGRDGFVARLAGDLTASGADRLSYYGGSGDDRVTGMAVKDGQVYLAGASGGDLPGSPPLGRSDGFLVRMDAASGAVGWSRRFMGRDGVAAPTAVAVAGGSASVLDRLGLPKGALSYDQSDGVVASTSARAGDGFVVKAREGGRGVAVTITADDTLDTLAAKMNRALGFNARAEVFRDGDYQRIRIKTRSDRAAVEITPGKGGADALAALGLSEGVVRAEPNPKLRSSPEPVYGLALARDLRLSDSAAIKRSMGELTAAMTVIRTAYRDLASPKTSRPVVGEAPAYLKTQIANYQAALDRLTA